VDDAFGQLLTHVFRPKPAGAEHAPPNLTAREQELFRTLEVYDKIWLQVRPSP
jgi:hypothetical protein